MTDPEKKLLEDRVSRLEGRADSNARITALSGAFAIGWLIYQGLSWGLGFDQSIARDLGVVVAVIVAVLVHHKLNPPQ